MFKFIAFIFLLLTSLIVYQVGVSIYPSYQMKQYVQTQGVVLGTQIFQDKQRFQVLVEYLYQPNLTTYRARGVKRLINNNYTLSLQQAQNYSASYKKGDKIDVYFDYHNPEIAKLDIGLSTEEYSKILFLFPIILSSILCFILAYVEEWSLFAKNNAMGPGSFGLFLSLLTSGIIDILSYFYFNMILTPMVQIIFLICCFFMFLVGFTYRKINHRDIFMDDKYKRLYNTEEVKQREEQPMKRLFYRFKTICLLPLSILNGGCLLVGLFLFLRNDFISSKHLLFLGSSALFLSVGVLLYLLKRETSYHTHSTTFN